MKWQLYRFYHCLKIVKVNKYILSLLLIGMTSISLLRGQHDQSFNGKGFALFSILSDTSSTNPFKFVFTDKSPGEVVSWYWDFGDGHTSEDSEVKHEYEEPGIYTVCLTIIRMVNNQPEESITCKNVRVADKGYFNLGGHVFVNQLPIEEGGVAYLYAFDSTNTLYAVDTCNFDTLGFYYFYQQKDGRYIIKTEASREFADYESYIPTYFGDVVKWTDAEVIQFDTTIWEYDIYLQRVSYTAIGDGMITGTIAYDTINRTHSAINIPIYITDSDDRMSCAYSDENGAFDFENLDYGNYEISAEVTGLHCVPIYKTVNSNNPETVSVSLLIQEDQIIAAIPEEEEIIDMSVNISAPYPNPTESAVSIKGISLMDSDLTFNVYDQMGRLLESHEVYVEEEEQVFTFDVERYPKGIYFLQVATEGHNLSQKFVKK